MKILLLTGAPGVGKSTISYLLGQDERFNLIKSYTDRPEREDDVDHIFMKEDDLTNILLSKTCAAYTRVDGYRYFTLRSQFRNDKINVYTVDVNGMNDIIKSFPTADFMSVLITRKNVHIDQMRKDRIVEVPPKDQVNFTIDNDEDSPESVVNVLKFLTLYEDGDFFISSHQRVTSLQERIKDLETWSQRYWDEAQELREQLNVYIKETNGS